MTAVADTERLLGGADSSYFLSFCLPGGNCSGQSEAQAPSQLGQMPLTPLSPRSGPGWQRWSDLHRSSASFPPALLPPPPRLAQLNPNTCLSPPSSPTPGSTL